MPRQGPTIAETALRLIRERGPLALDDLVPGIVAAGRTRARDPRRAVMAAIDAHPGFVQAWDGRWCSLADQLEGAVFTIALTELERRDEIVVLRDDLALVERLAARLIPLAGGDMAHVDLFGDFFELPPLWLGDDGRPMRDLLGARLAEELLGFAVELGLPTADGADAALRELVDERRHARILHGPEGWLPALGRGQLLGLRVRSGTLEPLAIEPREIHGPHVARAASRVASLAQLVLGPDPSWFGPAVLPLEGLLELVATEAPEILRRPLPPFEEVVRRAGLEALDGYVAHRGFDWRRRAFWQVPDLDMPWAYQPSRFVH